MICARSESSVDLHLATLVAENGSLQVVGKDKLFIMAASKHISLPKTFASGEVNEMI